MIRERLITIVRSRKQQALLVSFALLIALAAGTAGYLLAGGNGVRTSQESGRKILYWYDPMLPDERYPGPGKSSMGMELIPKYADEGEGEGVRVSSAMAQNLGIRVVRAEIRDIASSVPAVGRVELDERLIAEVQTLTPGFVESLAVRAEGEPVGRGRQIATVYSPELLGAQQEYVALRKIKDSAITPGLRQAARRRLGLLGLPEGAIQRLDRGGSPQRNYAVFAPASGVVSKIGAREGAQVTPGQSIVTIAGLSRVLVIAEVPEASIGDTRVGLPVRISFNALPGEVREGRIDYIFPSLDPQSRTARVRVTLDNPGGRLRQGMFANVQIMGTGGTTLVVPSEAVIDTGRRKIVIVKRNETFIPAEIQAGRETGEWTQIVSGLSRGEEVVASGQFLIDSEASIAGVMGRLNRDSARGREATDHPARVHGKIITMDTGRGQITVDHGPIPAMNWPAMTMVFHVQDPSMLRGFKRGDHVSVTINPKPHGNAYMIEQIERAPGR